MGGACGTYGGEERCIQAVMGKPEGKKHLKELGVDGRTILKRILKSGMGLVDSIDLGQNRDRWPAPGLVNAITIIQFPQKAGNFLTS
jgi:hypothetical protein